MWEGEQYQARFDRLAAEGEDVHGEADFVSSLDPSSALDAGCGTGRVAIELARRGVDVVGVDIDASMLAAARARAPDIEWVEADLTTLELGFRVDVVVMAGNIPLFVEPGRQDALVRAAARHLAPDGKLVTGFSTNWAPVAERPYTTADLDRHCTDAGLTLLARFSTWDRAPWTPSSDYAVSVHSPADPGTST